MIRSTLGTVVGALLRAQSDFECDPISAYYHVWPDPRPRYEELARELGWSLPEIARALDERGVSHRWQYFSAIGAILEVA